MTRKTVNAIMIGGVLCACAVLLPACGTFRGTVTCSSGRSETEITVHEGRPVGDPQVERLPNGDLQVRGEFADIRERRIPPGQEYQDYTATAGVGWSW